MSYPILQSPFALNQVRGSVFANAQDKLKSSIATPYMLRFGDGSTPIDVPFLSGAIDKSFVEAYIARNRLVNPNFTIDSISDGKADNWQITENGVTNLSYSIDGGQKLTITSANTNSSSATMYQDISGIAGETFEFKIEYKTDMNMNARFAFQSGSNVLNTVVNKKSVGDWTTETFTGTIKPGDTFVRLLFGIRADNVNGSGSVWFRNASVKKVVSFALNDSLTVDSNANDIPDGWTLTKTATGSTDVSSNGVHLNMTSSSAQFQVVQINYDNIPISANEIFTIKGDNKLTETSGNVYSAYQVIYKNSSGVQVGSTIAAAIKNSTTNVFDTFSATLTAPNDVTITKFMLSLFIQSGTVGGGDVGETWFKNVKVFRINVSAFLKTEYDESGEKTFNFNYSNFISNGNFANGTTGWGLGNSTLSVSNNMLSVTGNGTNPSFEANQSTSTPVTTGKKYYIRAKLKINDTACQSLAIRVIGSTGGASTQVAIQNTPTNGNQYTLSGIYTGEATHTGNVKIILRATYADSATANNKVMQIQEVIATDLTSIFGANAEPTVAECETLFPFTDTSSSNVYRYINDASQSTDNYQPKILDNGIWLDSPKFDGVDDHLIKANTPSIDITSPPISIFVYIKPDLSLVTSGYVLAKNISTAVDVQYGLLYEGANQRATIILENGSRLSTPNGSITQGTGYFVGFTWDGTNVKSYVNGQLVSSGTFSGTLTSRPNLYIGCRGSIGIFFKGDIDYPMIFKQALTQADVTKLYKQVKKRYTNLQ